MIVIKLTLEEQNYESYVHHQGKIKMQLPQIIPR